jgi:hypothetical protein
MTIYLVTVVFVCIALLACYVIGYCHGWTDKVRR